MHNKKNQKLEIGITLLKIFPLLVYAFFIGISIHSLAPYDPVPVIAITIGIIVSLLAALFLETGSIGRIMCLCFLFLILGIWRFEAARPSLPPNLKPFSPEGFAHVSNDYHTANKLDPRYWLNRFKSVSRNRSDTLLVQNESALLKGMLWGETTFTKDMKEGFRRAGLMHLVAVSGSNVTILMTLLVSVLIACRLTRKTSFIISSVLLFAFVLFVGFSAAVVRAAIMGWLVAFAPMVGRLPNAKRLLLISAVIFVIWQPWALLFDVSFALSFLAMIGLLIWSPLISEKIKPFIASDLLRETISTTLSATVMTLPYGMWAFGQASLLGLVTNLIAVPLVPWIMAVGSLGLVIGTSWAMLPAKGFLDVVLWLGDWANTMAIGVWQEVNISIWLVLFVYLGIVLLYWRAKKSKEYKNT